VGALGQAGDCAGNCARCGMCVVLGTRALFLRARVALLASHAPPPFLAALSPRLAARWHRRPASRARRRRACCLPCVLARPAAWPLPAACSVHGENWPAAVAVLVLEHAPALMLSCLPAAAAGLRVRVLVRARGVGGALCVFARARARRGRGAWRAPVGTPHGCAYRYRYIEYHQYHKVSH
jgi:hypothetical protein